MSGGIAVLTVNNDTGVIVIKQGQASPSVFKYCKNWTVGRPRNETRF